MEEDDNRPDPNDPVGSSYRGFGSGFGGR